MKDYYAILAVSRDATAEEIKRAFRKLARDTHPDANPGDAGAEERFREIAEAYEVLSDPQRRAAYDRGDQFDVSGLFANLAGIEDLFDAFFGGGFRTMSTRPTMRGPDVAAAVELTLDEAATGVEREVAFRTTVMCTTCEGIGAHPDHPPERCERCGGSGSVQSTRRTILGQMTSVATCERCRGSGLVIDNPCPGCLGAAVVQDKRTVTVEIPPGIDDHTRLRLGGRGGSAGSGTQPGDLYVDVRILPDDRFRREGETLYHTLRIGMVEAALGTSKQVPLLGGEEMTLDLPSGTQPGAIVRIPRAGMPRLRRRGRGDLFVEVEVVVPIDLSSEERRALEEFAELQGETPVTRPRRGKRSR